MSVLVGAPKANTSQPGIVEAGAVYYCPWPGQPDSCRQIPFDNSSELPKGFLMFLGFFLVFFSYQNEFIIVLLQPKSC